MGNSMPISLGTVQFYNCTPFVLKISIDRRIFQNEPWKNRITNVDQVSSENAFVEISMLDSAQSSVIKKVSFFTRREFSWIISDVEVRRQAPGYPIYVAEDWSTETPEDLKHFVWIYEAAGEQINEFPALRRDDEYTENVKINGPVTVPAANCFTLFNDSPYLLDVRVLYRPTGFLSASSSEKTQIRYHRNYSRSHVTSERLLTIESTDRYPLVCITALGPWLSAFSKESNLLTCKQVEFFAKIGSAWIVSDECIVRQAGRGLPPYIASVFENEKGEVAPRDMTQADRWKNADRIKRYEWTFIDLPVYRSKIGASREPQTRPDWTTVDLQSSIDAETNDSLR